MNTTQHLQLIKTECERLLANSRDNGIDKYTEPAEAGWRSTIAAIECIEEFERNGFIAHSWLDMTDKLITAWPLELLQQTK
jgi:hypothetical protein